MLVEYWDVMREYRAMQIRNEGGWTRDDTEPVNKSLGEYKHEYVFCFSRSFVSDFLLVLHYGHAQTLSALT